MGSEHELGTTDIHHDWDASREPALRVRPSDVVHFDLLMAGDLGPSIWTSSNG